MPALPTDTVAIAIVGAGPRGTSVLERLIANAPSRSRLRVEVIEPFAPGSGATWRTDQHPSLLMNTTAGTATVYTDDTVPMLGPVVPGPTLLEWAADGSADPTIDDELRRLDAGTSPSRRVHGHYLDHAFADIAMSGRELGIDVRVHRQRVTDLEDHENGRQLLTLTDGDTIEADAVVLCLGHIDATSPATAPGQRAIAPGVIIDQDIALLAPGEDVIVRGAGLGLYDLIALISHPRGGRFDTSASGRLRYLASGREPRLWVGSRRGFPFRAKPRLGRGTPWEFRAPSDEVLASLHARRGELDFRTDLWPRIAASAAAAYLTVAGGSPADLALCLAAIDDPRLAAEALDALARTSGGTYHPETSGDPLAGRVFSDVASLTSHVSGLLHEDLAESRRGWDSAVKAADFAIGASRGWLHRLTAHGGLTPASQRDDLDGWFDGYANSLAGGPPAGRAAELAALVDAGIVGFLGAQVRVDATPDGYRARSTSVPGRDLLATALVDARLAVFDVATSTDPLISRLRERGEIRSHRLTSGTDHHDDGRIAVERSSRSLLGADDRPHPRRFAIGVPVGGAGNASFTAMAHTSSPFLAETDAVARTALAAVGILSSTAEAA